MRLRERERCVRGERERKEKVIEKRETSLEKKKEEERKERRGERKKFHYSVCDRTVPNLERYCSPMPNYLAFRTPHVIGFLVLVCQMPNIRAHLMLVLLYELYLISYLVTIYDGQLRLGRLGVFHLFPSCTLTHDLV